MKAILLHHAGGDKYAYKNFQQLLLPEIESMAFELPGRSDRYGEPLLKDIESMTEDLFGQIENELDENYFFVGVSMGTLFAYLLSHKINEKKLPMPKYLFLASRLSSESYADDPTVLNISSEEFWKVVIKYDGVSQALIEHQELREFYEPILRADFEALEKYNFFHPVKEKLSIPTSILVGEKDIRNITIETAQNWKRHFTNEISFKEFDGGHFFLYENEDVVEYIKSTLNIGK